MRSRKLWIGVLVAGALAAGGVLFARGARDRETARRVALVLDEAGEILAAAEKEGLVPLAEEAFGIARAGIDRAQALLAGGEAAAALPVGEEALARARDARALAEGRVPVPRAAVLRKVRNTVLHRGASGVAWASAVESMSLYDLDRIATKERAEAVVAFDEVNEMRVEENSVMVVERLTESRAAATLSLTMSVPEGSVRSRVAREADRDVRLVINLPKANVVVDTQALAGGQAEVGTQVNPDQTNRVAVYTGEAELVSPSGERVVVHQNQFAEVGPDGRLSAPRELPTSAIILVPGRNATVYVSQHRPEVTFKWKSDGGCAAFRLEVARDEAFLDKVLDEKVKRQSFTYGNLNPARYLWRMSCLDDKGTAGQATTVSIFDVIRDDQAPRLTVLAPAANASVAAATVVARCRTEAEAAVFINGEEAESAGGGEFSRTVTLKPGLNTLVFEAIDAAGNVIYNSLLVTRTP